MRRAAVALASLAVAALAGLGLGGSTASADSPVPLPAALAGHPYAKSFLPPELVSSTWAPKNSPGQCNAAPGSVKLNSAGFAQLSTTGQAGNCTDIESPHTYPTKPGYVYEARIYTSNFADWSAYWMFGTNWPSGGEVDATEPQFGQNYVSWHYAPCNSSAASSTKGTDPWSYPCKTTVTPAGADIGPGWHTVDVAYTSSAVQVYYDGHLYVSIPETLTSAASAPMWIVFSEGSCNAGSAGNTCSAGGEGTPGNVQVAWLRVFT